MRDFVVYHNPEKMGGDVEDFSALSIVTNKPAPRDVRGSRVWLLTGRGAPRTFLLRSYFIVDHIETGTPGFRTKLSGERGKVFDPLIELNEEEWFYNFKKSQGNFARGLQRVTSEEFIRGLEALADTKQ